MNVNQGEIANPNTVVFKNQQPQTQRLEMREISDTDFQNFSYTGLEFIIPVPLAQTTSDALICINIDGFIPTPNLNANVVRNLFPVQRSYASRNLPGLDIKWTWSSLVAISNYLSYRMVSGQVGICLRIASQTAQAGNLLVTQGSGLMRKFYAENDLYTGLRFNNNSQSAIDYSPNGFCLIDLSLNRTVSIQPVRRENTYKTDFAKKLVTLSLMTDINLSQTYTTFSSQFLEDWLFISMQGDLPHPEASEIVFNLYFDWSKVEFTMPMLAFISSWPTLTKQILLFIQTFNNKNSTTLANSDTWNWLPRDARPRFNTIKYQKYHLSSALTSVDGKHHTHSVKTMMNERNKFLHTTTESIIENNAG